MNKVSHMLEIYEPGSESDLICGYSSETSFPKISKGELVFFPEFGQKVRVTEIIHLVFDNEKQANFKTMIYTENIT